MNSDAASVSIHAIRITQSELFYKMKSYMPYLASKDDESKPWISFFYYKTENSSLVTRIYRSILSLLELENYCQILLSLWWSISDK